MHCSYFLPWVPEVSLACCRNFRCWLTDDTSSAIGWSHERRSQEKKPLVQSSAIYRPHWPLSFLSDYIYTQTDWKSPTVIIWTGTWRMSLDSHYPPKNKLEFKIHCVKRNHDLITSQFSIVDVTLQFKLQSILQDLDHWIWKWLSVRIQHPAKNANELGPAWQNIMQETVAFTDKKKIAYNYADPVLKRKRN